MKYSFIIILLLCSMSAISQSKESWKAFEIGQLSQEQENLRKSYLKFLDESSMSMGIYVLPAGAIDPQEPHTLDEAYYVLEGAATLRVEGDDIPVKPGGILFVRANASHSFVDIREDLKLLVFFSTGPIE